MAIGLLDPCLMSTRLIRNGSSGGMLKPEWPFGCCCTMSVMTLGRHSVSAGLHCGISAAVAKKEKIKISSINKSNLRINLQLIHN